MGWFNDIFKKKDESVSIHLGQVRDWFDEQVKESQKPVIIKIDEIRNNYDSSIEKLKEYLSALKEAELHNPRVTEKEIHFMEGNRDAYILKVNLFISQNRFPLEAKDVFGFAERFHSNLVSFSRATFKPYYILQEFFANESKNVALKIKFLEDSVISAQKLSKSIHIDEVSAIRAKIDSIFSEKKRLEDFSQDLTNKEILLANYKKKLAELENENKKLYSGEEYKKFLELHSTLELKKSARREAELGFMQKFSVLSHALKKYLKGDKDILSILYQDDPIKALLNDESFQILKILEGLKAMVVKGKIELKDRTKDKTISILDEIDGEFLSGFLIRFRGLIGEIETAERQISVLTVNHKIKLNEEGIKIIKREISEMEITIQQIKDRIKEENIQKMIMEVQESISDFLNKKIIISS